MKRPAFSLDHTELLADLARTDNLLIIQDLDGVCMGLVRDPLTRAIPRRYVDAARTLDGHFYVLTNGEHIGSRGVNAIVDSAFETTEAAGASGHYLPGLGAGGVQLQDRHGRISHPGVSEAELGFLAAVPDKARAFLEELLGKEPYGIGQPARRTLIEATVLDNPASPTLNLNSLHAHLRDRPALYASLQDAAERFTLGLQDNAQREGLGDSFFIHYAPNLGRDDAGMERVKPAAGEDAGTTDFQFMLKGAIKEVGVLVLLNQHYFQRTGHHPLGAGFNARQAPRDHDALLALARERFDPRHMPRLVGVGDTVTSVSTPVDGVVRQLRGGSDRGFLTLVQELGEAFGTDNVVIYIDSSRGEVERPGVLADQLRQASPPEGIAPWPALVGITDADDPLHLDAIFAGGHQEYVAFFCELAARRVK